MALEARGFARSVSDLPRPVREHLERFAAVQRDGAETDGDPLELTRRYTLEDGSTYFPEVNRAMTTKGVLGVVMVVAGLVALLAGIFIRIEGVEWATFIAIGGVVMIVGSIGPLTSSAVEDLVRRKGVEDIGLYLLPELMVIWRSKGLSLYPRSSIVEFERVTSNVDSDSHREMIRFRRPDGELDAAEVVSGDRGELRALMSEWLRR